MPNTLERLKAEIFETIEELRDQGVNLDSEAEKLFESLSASTKQSVSELNRQKYVGSKEENDAAYKMFKNVLGKLKQEQATIKQNQEDEINDLENEDFEPAPEIDDPVDKGSAKVAPKIGNPKIKPKVKPKPVPVPIPQAASDDGNDDEDSPPEESSIKRGKIKPPPRTAASKEQDADDYNEEDETFVPESEPEPESEDDEDLEPPTKTKKIKPKPRTLDPEVDQEKIDTFDDTEELHEQEVASNRKHVAMPLTVNSKLSTNVNIVDTEKVEEVYATLLKLKHKLDLLIDLEETIPAKVDGAANPEKLVVQKLLRATYQAYDDSMDYLSDAAKETFPAKLEEYGEAAKKALLAELFYLDDEGKKVWRFDTKSATFSRYVRISNGHLAYVYQIWLKKVQDGNKYAFDNYLLTITQSMELSEEEANEGRTAKTKYYVTRLLRENPNYQLGKEVLSKAQLVGQVKKILAFDSLRSDIERISIPYTGKELSKTFLSDHVDKVIVDDERHKILVKLKTGTTDEDVQKIIPDFVKNLGSIVNLKKLAIKYKIDMTKNQIEFIIIHKTKDSAVINRSQLLDMKERYKLNDKTFRDLQRFFAIGN